MTSMTSKVKWKTKISWRKKVPLGHRWGQVLRLSIIGRSLDR